MYIIKKDYKRTFKNYTFGSYDAARTFLRKQLRKRYPWQSAALWAYSNPNLGNFGYSIQKV